MSAIHYYTVEIDLPEVVGTCTINGNPGFSTPLTCTDQNNPTTTIKTHKFTDTGLVLSESDIHKCVSRVSETTPKLKAGNGVASRATCSVSFTDFIADPNMTSPALVASPAIANRGTFFGKLKERNILANKAVRVKYWRRENGTDTLVRTNNYIATDIKRGSKNTWVLTGKDVLYRADDEKSQFPKVVTGSLSGDITAGQTSILMQADIADWSPFAGYCAVIGKDILIITNATGNANQVTLTCTRANTINLGSRVIINQPEEHSGGDEVFRGRIYANSDLYDVIADIFEDAGISTSEYDGTGMQSELNSWLANIDNSIDCIFYEAEESTKVLNAICATFMLDIWTDTQLGKIKLKATSPWNTTTAVLKEGEQIIYDTISIEEPKDLHYSRAFLQYDKRKLTENDDDVNFARSSLAVNTDLEGENFYDEEKVKKLGKSIVLSNKDNNIESADLTTVRYAQRFSNRPQKISFEIDEVNLNFSLGDVVEICTNDNQDFYGNPKQGVRAQVSQISPNYSIGRRYKISTITYNPFIGGVDGSDQTINSTSDINLFTESGGVVDVGTYTFLFDGGVYGQDQLSQAISVGSFPSGSTINLVLLNGAILIGRGGDGGYGGSLTQSGTNIQASDGTDGGNTLKGNAGLTINVYLNGSTGDLGNGSYTADGYLYAAGGGGAGGSAGLEEESGVFYGGGGGGGGAGFFVGAGGQGGFGDTGTEPDGEDGTSTTGGDGAGNIFVPESEAGNGGGLGQPGQDAGTTDGGAAGHALDKNGANINILTSGQTSRFVQGGGDTPDSLT